MNVGNIVFKIEWSSNANERGRKWEEAAGVRRRETTKSAYELDVSCRRPNKLRGTRNGRRGLGQATNRQCAPGFSEPSATRL